MHANQSCDSDKQNRRFAGIFSLVMDALREGSCVRDPLRGCCSNAKESICVGPLACARALTRKSSNCAQQNHYAARYKAMAHQCDATA